MKMIHLDELLREGYEEDTVSLRQFERGYAAVTIPGVIGFAFGFYLIFGSEWRTEGSIVSAICFVVLGAACVHAYRARPKSAKTGQRMEKYERLGGRAEEVEFIYVDHASRTFCRRVAATRGD